MTSSPKQILRFADRWLFAAAFSLWAATAFAQAPTLNPPFPLGMQRGTSLDLTLNGANLVEPTTILCSFPAKVTIPTANNNGKDNAKLLVHLEVPKDAPIGWHCLRVATTHGISNVRIFCLDDLPQVVKQGNNQTVPTAQSIPTPCVVCGQVNAEQMDYYKFTVAANQRLSFEVLGRRLGSPIDPQLILLNPRTGKQLAFSDDAPGLSKDPRLTYVFKEAGDYVLELRDVRYQGGGDWHYRLRIGDFPCATTPVPLAAKRGSTVQVSFAGPNVQGVPPQTVHVPTQPDLDVLWLAPAWPNGPTGWPVMLTLTDLDEAVETEPNDEPAKANKIAVPGAVSARFEKKGDHDHYAFTAKKGERILIDAHTYDLHSPTSVYMILKSNTGAQIAASNPAADPARIDFTAPADGEFTLAVEHLHYWGGPEESYRLTLLPYQPGFTLTATADHLDIPQGTGAVLAVQAARRDYNGPIEISVPAGAGISGSVTIPEGQNGTLLYLTAPPNAAAGGQYFQLTGKATINGKPVVEKVSVLALLQQAMNNLPHPPAQLADQLAFAVTDKPPFTLQAKYDSGEGIRGLAVPVTLTATKTMGFDEEITISSVFVPPAAGQQPTIPPATVKIPKGQTQAKIDLKPAANAPLGPMPLTFRGTAKVGAREYAFTVPYMPLPLALPFELTVDTRGGQISAGLAGRKKPGIFHALDLVGGMPRPVVFGTLDLSFLSLAPAKHKIKVAATRKGGYKGPIALELRNLPPNVTAPKVTLAENQTEIEIELTAAANTAAGEKADVNVLGVAPAAGNQQNASPNFTLKVGPPK